MDERDGRGDRDALTLVDELTGETVAVPAGATVAEAIDRRLSEADHPRSDFRGNALQFELHDSDGRPLPADRTLTAGTDVHLTSPDAGEVITRRNRWLDDLATDGVGTESVAAGTQLALVERTASRLDEVARLRAELASRRTPPPRSRSRFRVGGLLLTALVLLIVAGIFAAWAWWFLDELDTSAQRGAGNRGAVTTVAADGVFIEAEEEVAVAVGGSGIRIDACDVIEVTGVEVPAEIELELGCEVAIIPLDAGEEGISVEISARSGRGDPIVWVLDEDGDEVAFNDDSGGLNSFLTVDLDPGPHQIQVGNLTQELSVIDVSIELI